MPLSAILPKLPTRVAEALLKYPSDDLLEIRLRADRPMTITTVSGNRPLGLSLTEREITETVERLCEGSLHAYSDTIRQGFIPLSNGCRAGVCGRLSGHEVIAISSIAIRIPRTVKGIGATLCRRLLAKPGQGMLLYSPPGEGKTTLLRDIASILSSPPYLMRVALIDSREELYRPDAFRHAIADVYTGYPKAMAMDLAIRTMSPQYLICDELGAEEAEQILVTQNAGVPLVASAHASSLSALLQRPAMQALRQAGVFSLYVGLRREGRGYYFDITEQPEDSL